MIEEVKRILDHECVYCDHKEAEDCTTCRAQQIDDLYQQKMRELFEEMEEVAKNTPTYSVCEGINLRIPELPAKLIMLKDWQSLKEKYESTETKEA